MITELITWLEEQPAATAIPAVMPSPFATEPHPLARTAAAMLQQKLELQALGQRPDVGKMFGVLVVRADDGRIGFLSAFSGMINGQWQLPGFVPQIFPLAGPGSSLAFGDEELAGLTARIEQLESSAERTGLLRDVELLQQQRQQALAELKANHRAAKAERKQLRLELTDVPPTEREVQMAALALTSQRQKREATNTAIAWDEKVQKLQLQLDVLDGQIDQIRQQRTEMSRRLHRAFFESYRLSNWLLEEQPITRFFPDSTPPAGAGDCAGPKLIHYAHRHGLQPIALAEFWWGASPSTGIRHHGHFYPACRGKCRPILPFMLQGLKVEPHPDFALDVAEDEPQTVYEDEFLLVINKPAGLMSTPGKRIKDSVQTRLQARYPDCPELKLVHRLDMGTSGLLLVAKTLAANKRLQRQFVQRTVEKRYEALLSKVLPEAMREGEVNLPLRTDFDDTPRQMVCFDYGKPALTHWQVIDRNGETTRVWFYPHTGRTHQLRMHAAHKDGLNAAIVGDDLYGLAAERMMLHAQRLCFTHPFRPERMEFEAPAPF